MQENLEKARSEPIEKAVASATVVIGVGNTIFSDDGAGVHAARLLQNDPRLPPDVTILDGGTIGLELLPYVADASRVLVLDAMDGGEAPGTLMRLQATDLLRDATSRTAHQLGVVDLITALALVSSYRQEILVLGVQPAFTGWGTMLSAEVKAALEPMVEAALRHLLAWSRVSIPAEKSHPSFSEEAKDRVGRATRRARA
jgi:hydrogenase maturation protease